MSKIWKASLFLISLIGVFSLGSAVYALEVNLPGLPASPSFGDYVSFVFNTVMQLSTGLVVAIIAFGGLHYLVSLGMGKITNEGKEWIKAGVLGLMLLMTSYLIIYTINPDILSFGMNGLLPFPTFYIKSPSGGNGGDGSSITFQEIPTGTLIETLLARQIDCFDFNSNGDPIDGVENTGNILEPTFINHDRVDCISKLTNAIDIKTQIFKKLSEEISTLMKTCVCKPPEADGVCAFNCAAGTNQGCRTTACPGGGCAGNCVGTSCLGADCCTPEVRQKIDHGLIDIGICEGLGAIQMNYQGLDEYISDYPGGGGEIARVIEKEIPKDPKEPDKEKRIAILSDKWEKLKLIDKIYYLKSKIQEITQELESDLGALTSAKAQMANCYLLKSYPDFLKTLDASRQQQFTINTAKPYGVDSAKYCKGFLFTNSSFFNSCQNMCPLVQKSNFGCAQSCSTIPANQPAKIATCMKDCMTKSSCVGGNKFNTFQGCMDFFKEDCISLCDKEYVGCDEELKTCKKGCEENSKDLFNNMGTCYFNFTGIFSCTTAQGSSAEAFENCAKDAFECKYCSSQNPGDPECLKIPTSNQKLYSASTLYQNPNTQKCPTCYGADGKTVYPECDRCPTCSNCPQCPCIGGDCNNLSQDLLTCTGECGEFGYDQDPLTFYCRNDWWNDKSETTGNPLGQKLICSQAKDIPVGQTVDESLVWAKNFLKAVKDFVTDIDKFTTYIKEIGEEAKKKEHCKCDSKCGGGTNCKTDCEYEEHQEEDVDEDGNPLGTYHWVCSCTPIPCKGDSCLDMILRLIDDGSCPNGASYEGVPSLQKKVSTARTTLENFIKDNGRSEIFKRLVYSRKNMNTCSSIATPYSGGAKLLSCQRIMDEIVSPLGKTNISTVIANQIKSGYCYGTWTGKVFNHQPMSDNWYCCENWEEGSK